jgi:hypothetical protein
MEFDQGAVVYFACTFRDVDGALVDPNPVTLTVRAPAGTLTAPAITHPSLGEYRAEAEIPVAAPSAGVWRWRWYGAGVAADEGAFMVTANQVG